MQICTDSQPEQRATSDAVALPKRSQLATTALLMCCYAVESSALLFVSLCAPALRVDLDWAQRCAI